jgi:hypothetical protein
MENQNLLFQNENLIADDVVIHDIISTHHAKLTQIIPISNSINKNYYYKTKLLEPNSVCCRFRDNQQNGIAYKQYYFTFNNIKNSDELLELIQKLNKFKHGITDRMKYMMKIPEYDEHDNNMYNINADMITINKERKFRNILQIKEDKNNIDPYSVMEVLKACKCEFLFHIKSVLVSENIVKLSMRMVRIYPESLDTLNGKTKIVIVRQLNNSFVPNVSLDDLNNIRTNKMARKQEVKDELKKMFL